SRPHTPRAYSAAEGSPIAARASWWVYLVGPMAGAAIAVLVARFLRGPAKSQEARAAMGDPSAAE
ncbi:MAG: porin, partial [Actinomycetota bacterium]